MSANDYVSVLYRHILGREADPAGLQHWTSLIEERGDPTIVLAALLASEEYRDRFGRISAAQCEALVTPIAEWLTQTPPIIIVDVGAQLLGLHAYQRLLDTPGIRCEIIGFEPLETRIAERTSVEGGHGLTLLPYAIGNGEQGTLNINNLDGTSSLFELNESLTEQFVDLANLRTEQTMRVQTRRLDDVLPAGRPVDFLKLDIQGGELAALDGAEETLERTAVVHCEVEFASIYRDQPLFCDINNFLTQRRFEFIDLVKPTRYAYKVPSRRAQRDRLIWDEAVFYRGLRAVGDDPRTLAIQALIALLVYDKPTLAERLLVRHHELTGAALTAAVPS